MITVATEGKTTLFKASELLEFTMEPFQYARRAAQDNFDLSRLSADSLRSYDSSFTKMMSARLESDMPLASSCEEDCFRHLGEYLPSRFLSGKGSGSRDNSGHSFWVLMDFGEF